MQLDYKWMISGCSCKDLPLTDDLIDFVLVKDVLFADYLHRIETAR
jgi:hypothetical protein